jgi:hypothetical protein
MRTETGGYRCYVVLPAGVMERLVKTCHSPSGPDDNGD